MIIQRKAGENIQSMIDVIWYVDERLTEDKRTDIIMPSGHIHLVYNLGDPCYLETCKTLLPSIMLAGQSKTAIRIQYGHHVRQLGIAIKPYAFYRMFHLISSTYTELIVDGSTLEVMKPLHQKILHLLNENDDSIPLMLDHIEKNFEAFDHSNDDDQLLEKLVEYIEERSGVVDIKEMAKAFNYSVSALERKFKKYIGLTPKAYGDILRFRHAVLEQAPERLFYDQSHYIRFCKKYTHKIPSDIKGSDEVSLLHMLGLKEEKS